MFTLITQLLAQGCEPGSVCFNFGQQAVEQGLPGAAAGWDTAPAAAFGVLISQVLMIALTLGTIALLGFLLWGAIDWLTSGGDKGKTEKARDKITQAIVGLLLLISTVAIMLFVQQLLGICVIDFNGNRCVNPVTPQSCSGVCTTTSACQSMAGYPAGAAGCATGQICCLQ